MSTRTTVDAKSRLLFIALLIVGIAAIVAILVFLSSFLLSRLDPFVTSILVEITITSLIVGIAWGLHSKVLKNS